MSKPDESAAVLLKRRAVTAMWTTGLTLIAAGVLAYSFFPASLIAEQYAPLSDTASAIKYNAAQAHLQFEEAVSGGNAGAFRVLDGVLVLLMIGLGVPVSVFLMRHERQKKAHIDALRISEENLSITLRSIGDAVIAADTAGRIVRMNPVAEALTGWPAAEAAGQPMHDVFHIVNAQTRAPSTDPVQRVLEERVTVGLANHTILISRSGREHQIADSAAPIKNGQGEITGVVLVFRDVTEAYAREEALRRSEAKYRTFFENSADAMLIIENGEFVDCNAAAVALLGYDKKEELIPVTLNRVSPEMQPDGRPSAEKAEEMIRMATENGAHRFEWHHQRKDGTCIPVEVSFTAIEGPSGLQLHTVWRDLSKRRRAEEERDRLIRAIEQTAEIIVITDADANIQYVNPAFEQITGYSRDEVLGKNPRILQSGAHSAAFYKEMWGQLMAGNSWRGRFINKKKDGTLYTEEAAVAPVYDARSRLINFVAAKCDISYEIELEQQLRKAQKMEAVGQMAGGIAHDFNNLLQVVSGYAELLQLDFPQPDSPVAKAAQEIGNAAQRGKSLVSQLLSFSRRQVMQPVALDLNAIIDPLLNMIRRLVGETIELTFIGGNNLASVCADHGLMEQMLMNLCVNARDAMPRGGRLIIETANVLMNEEFSRTHPGTLAGPQVLLSVTDTGCGMDRQTIEHIFEPFFTTKEVGKGTGLGLAMVYGIVKQHKGYVSVDSEPGRGTVFKIYLPAVDRRAADVPRPAMDAPGGGTETILLAEDDENVLHLAAKTLRSAGYTVLTAMDGKEALNVFEQHAREIDMVLLDVMMPRMGGKEALEKIQTLRPELPYLFASGYSGDALHNGAIITPDIHLLSKPYRRDVLLREIRRILNASNSSRKTDRSMKQ